MPFLQAAATFAQALDEITKQLGKYGEVEVSDDEGKRQRNISFFVSVPGYGLPTAARLDYRERYKRSAQGWLPNVSAKESSRSPSTCRLGDPPALRTAGSRFFGPLRGFRAAAVADARGIRRPV